MKKLDLSKIVVGDVLRIGGRKELVSGVYSDYIETERTKKGEVETCQRRAGDGKIISSLCYTPESMQYAFIKEKLRGAGVCT